VELVDSSHLDVVEIARVQACFLPGRAKDVSSPRYAVENASLLGCYAPSTGKQVPIHRRTAVPSPLESNSP